MRKLGHVAERWWWYQGDDFAPEWRPPGTYLTPGEPEEAFRLRMQKLVALLQSIKPQQPVDGSDEACIALVCHAEVIYALTGKYVSNCACIEMRTSDLDASVESL